MMNALISAFIFMSLFTITLFYPDHFLDGTYELLNVFKYFTFCLLIVNIGLAYSEAKK